MMNYGGLKPSREILFFKLGTVGKAAGVVIDDVPGRLSSQVVEK